MEFSSALDTYFEALRERDLDALANLLAESDELTVILPNGLQMRGYDEVSEFHRTWFGDPEWQMNVELLHIIETDAMAQSLHMVEYDDLDASGTPYHLHYFLSLTFLQVQGQWRLIHDQCTLVHEGR